MIDVDKAEEQIEQRIEKDRFDNDVSIITLSSGRKLRMVHHTSPGRYRGRASIYAGKGIFLLVSWFESDNDCQANTVCVGGMEIAWGDGDSLGVEINDVEWVGNPVIEALTTAVDRMPESRSAFIVTVVEELINHLDLWSRKDVPARSAA